MSQSDKAIFYKELKEAGVEFDRHYREYSTEELREAAEKLRPQEQVQPVDVQPAVPPSQPVDPPPTTAQAAPPAPRPKPVSTKGEMPGQRLNTNPGEEPIKVDENGLIWYQVEVLKPAFPKPRGRRVLKYLESGTRTETVQNGEYIETFEVAGNENARSAEVKITLPSYQVGIYKDPRFPFRIHVYNENRGFDLFEVQNFYGGSDLVPAEIKRVYVENVLCFDIRTTIRAIQTEARQLQLMGRMQ